MVLSSSNTVMFQIIKPRTNMQSLSPSLNWTCAGVCGEVSWHGANTTVCCVESCEYDLEIHPSTTLTQVFIVIPANGYTTWWASWVFGLGGAALGFLLTLVLLTAAKELGHLCLAGCQPKRAWPDCFCWRKVSLDLYAHTLLEYKPCFCVVGVRNSQPGERRGGVPVQLLPGHQQPPAPHPRGTAARHLLHLLGPPRLRWRHPKNLLFTCCGRTLSPA